MAKSLNFEQAQRIADAIHEAVGYYTDSSCSDPDCCNGPYYTIEDLEQANLVLSEFGLIIENT